MNNCICCTCLNCGQAFQVGIADLLDRPPDEVIGEAVWCGFCDESDFQCHWGIIFAGNSRDTIRRVIRPWLNWSSAYRTALESESAER